MKKKMKLTKPKTKPRRKPKPKVAWLPKDEFCSGDYGVDKTGGLKTN